MLAAAVTASHAASGLYVIREMGPTPGSSTATDSSSLASTHRISIGRGRPWIAAFSSKSGLAIRRFLASSDASSARRLAT